MKREAPNLRWQKFAIVGFILMLAAIASSAYAQVINSPTTVTDAYRAAAGTWLTTVFGYAQRLFALLAIIQFAWGAAVLALERADLQGWVAGAIRQIMWIGVFYTLLLYGGTWIPAIIDSFVDIGAAASGTGELYPSDVFGRGVDIAVRLFSAANEAGFFSNTGSAFALVFAALATLLSFVFIAVQLVVALVESFIVVSAGIIFLGFGGSKWTVEYVQRYIGLCVNVGVKLFVIYLLVAIGQNVSTQFLASASAIGASAAPMLDASSILGSSIILAAITWQAPKLISTMIGDRKSVV